MIYRNIIPFNISCIKIYYPTNQGLLRVTGKIDLFSKTHQTVDYKYENNFFFVGPFLVIFNNKYTLDLNRGSYHIYYKQKFTDSDVSST